MFELDRADGTKINRIFQASPSEFSASSEQCDVRIGPNRFQGDLHTYEIHVEIDDVVADLTLRGTVPSWRPETGYFLFGEHSEYHFAWLPSVPQGDVEAAITIAGNRQQVTGVGYHDHNWGNFLMAKLMNNWYWGRGAVGNYTLEIFSLIAMRVTSSSNRCMRRESGNYCVSVRPLTLLGHDTAA